MQITMGKWSLRKIDGMIRRASVIRDAGQRIAFLSKGFIGTPYRESTLIGDGTTPEVSVLNLEAVDCFTLLDYVEAMRLSGSFTELKTKLLRVRYRSGEVSFEKRNHFFTDWLEFNSDFVEDATELAGGEGTASATKILNRKEDGSVFVGGIPLIEREVRYIPPEAINGETLGRLKTGDYAGIYSSLQGLDVSHVGIVIRENDSLLLRHASSRRHRVVDEDFAAYIAGKPGLIIFRPK